MTLVVDASVAARWLSKDGSLSDIAYSNGILERLTLPNERAHVPCHWSLEIANVATRGERMGYIEWSMVEYFLHLIEDIDFQIDVEASTRALTELTDLARHYRLTPYDAAYLELAQRLECPLATLDKDLRRAAEKAGLEVL
ncbi:MAG: type II toxin-antitoxin system VapC family toxin [Hyphomicrobiales bacterium]|jgi:predicted nucleic acid-binding protein|nr:type II toxin-antitoxin system VapC family toxin [Hyphomicrobiales bacterium]